MIQVNNGVVELKNDDDRFDDEVVYICDLTLAIQKVANVIGIDIKKMITRLYILSLTGMTLDNIIEEILEGEG